MPLKISTAWWLAGLVTAVLAFVAIAALDLNDPWLQTLAVVSIAGALGGVTGWASVHGRFR